VDSCDDPGSVAGNIDVNRAELQLTMRLFGEERDCTQRNDGNPENGFRVATNY
jgi:hypothetical protein